MHSHMYTKTKQEQRSSDSRNCDELHLTYAVSFPTSGTEVVAELVSKGTRLTRETGSRAPAAVLEPRTLINQNQPTKLSTPT